MSEQPQDRYDVSGNVEAQFVDAEQLILVNRPGITDLETLQIAEESALARAYETLLTEVRTDTPLTSDLLLHIHRRIFGELYEWGGRWRTVQISKPGAIWPAAQFLEESMRTYEREVLTRYPASKLGADEAFCRASAEIQGEFLSIHPFREGNARTIKVLNNLLAVQAGRPLLVYDSSGAGREIYIDGAKQALAQREYGILRGIIAEALRRGREQRER
jgi:cell filamentation protein